MEDELIHELSAAYALDALSPEEEREFEVHLAACVRCQEEVAAFTDVAAALAFAVEPAAVPSGGLRDRILAEARDDRVAVIHPGPRWAYPVAAVAAVAACAAIGLGIWAATLASRSTPQALRSVALHGATGSLVVARNGEATLVVSGLAQPPAGKTYEIWVVKGNTARPAGLFSAPHDTAAVHLTRRVPAGAQVGVTVEPAGGSSQPSEAPVFTSARS